MREVAVDFVCADVVKAEVGFLFGLKRLPVLADGFQQGVGAYDVGFDEVCGAVYGAVYVAFGGQVHDGVWLVLGQYAVYFGSVADVYLFEGVAFVTADFRQAFEVAGVGEFVEVDHFILGVGDDVTDDSGAYEAGAACY